MKITTIGAATGATAIIGCSGQKCTKMFSAGHATKNCTWGVNHVPSRNCEYHRAFSDHVNGGDGMQHLYRKIFGGVAELDEQIDKFRQLHDSYVIVNSSMNSRYS